MKFAQGDCFKQFCYKSIKLGNHNTWKRHLQTIPTSNSSTSTHNLLNNNSHNSKWFQLMFTQNIQFGLQWHSYLNRHSNANTYNSICNWLIISKLQKYKFLHQWSITPKYNKTKTQPTWVGTRTLILEMGGKHKWDLQSLIGDKQVVAKPTSNFGWTKSYLDKTSPSHNSCHLRINPSKFC